MVAPTFASTAPGVLSLTTPLVFAHRGGAALRPENTILAFDHGLTCGADGIECDVRLSRDGVVMVHHDATMERTTNGSGALSEHSASALARLDAGFHFRGLDGERYRDRHCTIPTLRDVLARYPRSPVIIELKGTDPAVAVRAVQVVRDAGALDRVCFGGFADRVVRAARQADPQAITSAAREEIRWFLYRSWVGLAPRRTPYRAFQVPEQAGMIRVVSPPFVRAARRAALPVQVWTVDDPAAMARLLRWGIAGLISDRPDLAAQVVRRWRAAASPAPS